MTLAFRALLFIVSLGTFVLIVRRIRAAKIQLEDSIFWILFAALTFVFSVFPDIFFFGSHVLGIVSPANLVWLFFIFVLLVKCFSMSVHISKTETQVRDLAQQLAIERLDRHMAHAGVSAEGQAAGQAAAAAPGTGEADARDPNAG